MIRINQIKIPVTAGENALYDRVKSILHTDKFTIVKIVRKSIDARHKDRLTYIYSLDVKSENEKTVLKKNINNKMIMSTNDKKYDFSKYISHRDNPDIPRPIIIGAGPAGYFCGLYLARMGLKPIIFERGKAVNERALDVESFWNGGSINPESNVSFGEGGAGTFSDGKLNTGIKDREGRIGAVIDDFISFGAPSDIAYLNKPHIGTDELLNVLVNMRREITGLGGDVLFESRLDGIDFLTDGNIRVRIADAKAEEEYNEFITSALVLAIGHSARDTFHMLSESEVPMEPKAYAIGVRIEHEAECIDRAQYGDSDAAKLLPAADYKMTYRSQTGRSVYSFCMCPGGFVVNASTDVNQSVVNGMSNHARDERNSNSAIVVNVTPEDFIADGFGDYGVLAGVEFQKKYERLAYNEGKGLIPVQRFGDYKAGRISEGFGKITPNIKGGYSFGNINNCLPAYVNNAIIEGIKYYDGRLKGFSDDDAVLSGIETRTSSPVRILRDENLMSECRGLFPCGEGAGYAGGITSAAVDGIKVAEAVSGYLQSI